jgi:glycosyltransferase involved in cell wall biosynthesis
MKILLIHWGKRGGGPKFALEIAKNLSDVTNVSLYISISKKVDNFEKWNALKANLRPIRTYNSALGALLLFPRGFIDALKLRNLLRKEKIDVVFSPMFSLWQSLLVNVWLPKGILFYSSVHDWNPHPGEENRILQFAQRVERKRAYKLVTYSSYTTLQASSAGFSNVAQFWHGVEANVTEPRKALNRSNPVIIGFFGRLLAYKGLSLFESCLIQAVEGRGLPVYGRVLGSGDWVQSHQSKSILSVENRWADEERITSFFKEVDIVMLPYEEASQSGVLPLSWSFGVPTIVTPVGGLVEQVKNSGAGLISDAISEDAICDELELLLGDPNLYEKLSNCGINAGRNGQSWKALGENLVHLWLQDLNGLRGTKN